MPLNKVKLEKEKEETAIEFLETLEEDDDVQNVYANLNLGIN